MTKMSRSPYIDNVVLTSKHSGRRTHKVQAFVIHHMAAVWTGKFCAEYFRDTAGRQASANYCIGYDGDVALNVEEENRAWTSSSNWADQRALTYELANSKRGHPWEVSDATIEKAIVMLAEQHKRYGLKKASYTGDTSGTLWRHDWFAQTNCPGPYLGGKLSYMADEINKILRGEKRQDKPASSAPTPKPSNSLAGARLVKNENAYFLATEDIKVRSAPSTTAKHTGTLPKGSSINYFKVYEGNGYRWLQYTGNSGNTLYVPYRESGSGKEQWGTFHDSRPKGTGANLKVDGYLGPEVVKALQSHYGLIVDGEIWGQYSGNQAVQAFNQKAVKYGKGGSPVVKALQKKIGATADGIWGAGTTRALQRYLGTPVDGIISRPSTAIKELQRRLNNGTF